MKKTGIMILGSILLLTACKKEQNLSPTSPSTSTGKSSVLAKAISSNLAAKISVSERGYLVLADSNVYADYINFLDSNSVQDIVAFHNSIGFTSQASIEGQAGNYIAPSASHGEYVFSQYGMVQIGNVLYRGVNSDGYLLAMPISNLNDNTFNAMVSKQFVSSVMCRLKVGGNYGENPEEFIIGNVGYNDTTTPPNPPAVCARHVVHTYSVDGVTIVDESWYFLGIRYKHVIIIYDNRG